MTQDPLSQAEDALTQGVFRTGRELARNTLINPTHVNRGLVPDSVIRKLTAIQENDPQGAELMGGMLICTLEETSGILDANELLRARCQALEEKLARAERTIRNLMDQVGG